VGGVAEISPDGRVQVEAVPGSPAAMLQGWERGAVATRAPDEAWHGAEAITLVGLERLDDIASALTAAREHFGFDRCEWGVADGQLWVLQLGAATRAPATQFSPGPAPPELIPLVQAVMAAPGVLGGELALPWAVAGPPSSSPTLPVGAGDLLDEAVRLAESLTSAVWGLPPSEAMGAARTSLARLRGPTPETEIATIRGLHQPDPDQASRLMSTIHTLGESLVARGVLRRWEAVWHLSTVELRAVLDGSPVRQPLRAWWGIWEPLAAAVALAHGVRHQGTPAAPGVGVGVRHHRNDAEAQTPPDRAVVTAPSAVPGLSQVIWGAAGLVTNLGSPAAHVFEVARSLGVPAVCGVDLGPGVDQIVAVDGSAGVVATLPYIPLRSDDPVQPGGVEP
jgi:phosphohistidine swiveling domain-containing protein